MLKYTLATMGALVAAIVAAFALVAWANGDDEPGLAPELAIHVLESSLQPASITVQEDQLVHLKLVNEASTRRVMSADESVQQLPPDFDGYDPRAKGNPVPFLRIEAPSASETSAFVRFTERGTFDVRVETPGRAGTLQVLKVVVV